MKLKARHTGGRKNRMRERSEDKEFMVIASRNRPPPRGQSNFRGPALAAHSGKAVEWKDGWSVSPRWGAESRPSCRSSA